MAPDHWHLAQLNVGYLKAPIEDPSMQGFVDGLNPINAIADAHPGFIWRLQGDDGESSTYVAIPGVDDPTIAVNFSVWSDLASLKDFMYQTGHVDFLRRRIEWFTKPPEISTILWWVPKGTIPTLEDAWSRLMTVRAEGPSQVGWTLRRPMDPPDPMPS